jgi:Flp pilus assembly pilin Flp
VADRRVPGAGQGLVEYTLILSLIAIVAILALAFFGDAIAAMLQLIGDEIDRAA